MGRIDNGLRAGTPRNRAIQDGRLSKCEREESMKVYEYHEIANIFPMMQDDEYERLKDDIAINGQLEPIVLYEGKVLDGRNRYKALCDIGLKTDFEEYQGDQPLSYVISKNLHRRHLTSSQKAMAAIEIEKLFAVEAKVNQGIRTDISQLFDKSIVREL